ncbi:type I-E CRISPR-associated endonuclease Cas1e [Olegusella massiliensis]|uniref:type I-E CRISPR-associated endonuclease Cas1e n=1 Tax=Olegusella massiliensis TaxID=1776381 RepID=UPI0023F7794A|nr:type I-E CRISPR-associated endonuclease Cas1e [Olegusella massiliensis]
MNQMPGIDKPDLKALPTVRERMTFLYVEHCLVNRTDGAITVTDTRGTAYIPAAALGVLMLGPGTNVSHRAIELMGDVGSTMIWVGEQGVRYYAHGRPLTHSSRLITKQAELVSNTRKRLTVARKMYQLRFPGEDVSKFNMQQLRGREGARIRSVYRRLSKEYDIPWKGREYKPDDFADATPINKALSVAHTCLYGAVHSVIVALGCSPALGFVHTGHERSFVFDVADLYKAELTIPIAFQVVAESTENLESETRHRVRDIFYANRLFEQITLDVRTLLLDENTEEEALDVDTLYLWDESRPAVKYGVSYGRSSRELLGIPVNSAEAYQLVEM